MITSITVLKVKSGEKEAFIAQTKELVEKTNEEEGCISFNLYQDLENRNVVSFIENWKNQEAIDFHFDTEFFKRIVPEILKLCEGDPVLMGKYEGIFSI